MDSTRIAVLACAVFVALGALVYANHQHQQAVAYRTRMVDEQTVQVTAASAHGRALAQRLLAPKLAVILDPQSPTYDTDAAFAEQIFADAVAALNRYRDISRDAYIDQVIASLEQGTTQRAINHFKQILALKTAREDSKAMARSYLHTGALYMISSFRRAGSDLRVAADLDSQIVPCMACLERLIAQLNDNTRVAADEPSPTPVPATPASQPPKATPSPTRAPEPTLPKKVADATTTQSPEKAQSPDNVEPAVPTADAPKPAIVAPPREEPQAPADEQPDEADAAAPAGSNVVPRPGLNQVEPLTRVEPEYPPRALQRGLEGYVVLEFVITRSGKVVDIRVVEASPPGVFERAAEQALKRWRYARGVGPLAGMRVRFEFKVR